MCSHNNVHGTLPRHQGLQSLVPAAVSERSALSPSTVCRLVDLARAARLLGVELKLKVEAASQVWQQLISHYGEGFCRQTGSSLQAGFSWRLEALYGYKVSHAEVTGIVG